jgi:hypothetical protein
LEICAAEHETKTSNLIILRMYRALSGDFKRFIKNIDDTLKYLHATKA